MHNIELLKKLGQNTFEVIERAYKDSNQNYEKFLSMLDILKPLLIDVSIEDVCTAFESGIKEPEIPIEKDDAGSPLEDVLTIPKVGEPLINAIKDKGWISSELENDFLESFYYKELLKKNIGLETTVLNEVAQNSLHILGRSNNPSDWGESKQGMVMGMVQSGKTVSMLALMGLGMAAGYNLFILLAGSKESLREQSQDRIREAFNLHNAGYFEDNSKEITIYSPTDSMSYSEIKGSAVQILKPTNPPKEYHPILIIAILKEINNLKKINEDIKDVEGFCKEVGVEFSQRYKAMILDDESDYASLNIKKDDIAPINRQLIKLRESIPMNCYIGYTATPQGCIAADPDSRVGYPKDFLWLLEPMKLPGDIRYTLSYMGLHEFFLQYENFIIKRLPKDAWPHHVKNIKGKKEGTYNPLTGKVDQKANLTILENEFADAINNGKRLIPQEFSDAMIEFVIGCGIRWYRFYISTGPERAFPSIAEIRKEYPYHAMMFNLSLTQSNHEKTKKVISKGWEKVVREFSIWKNNNPSRFDYLWEIQLKKTKSLKPSEDLNNLSEIQIFIDYAIQVTQEPISGQSPQNFIYKLNSSNEGDILNYYDRDIRKRTKKCAIFLGGNILSRGLTIDNLSVSVFVRTQASSLGDTNLQMCRWFGHKKKDVDLLSLYINDEIRGLFKDITKCDDALRASIKESIIQNKKPDKVLIELWSSNLFSATSPLKGRLLQSSTSSAISFSGKSRDLREPFCSRNIDDLQENVNAFHEFLKLVKFQKKTVNHLNRGDLYEGVDQSLVINFLKGLKIQNEALYVSPNRYADYLLDWDAGFHEDIIGNPMPIINIGVMGTNGVTQRSRTFTVNPQNKQQAIEFKKDAIGSLLGGAQREAKNKYKGDRFFDKSQEWHSKNIDIEINDRQINESILILFYLIDPNYVANLDKQRIVLCHNDEGFIDLPKILTFATITPLGGPNYKVRTNKKINIY